MNININKRLKSFTKKLTLTLGLGALVLTSACGKGPAGVVATVNGVDLTEEDFLVEYTAQRNNAIISSNYNESVLSQPSYGDPSLTVDQELRRQTLENMIQMEVIKQDAEAKGVKIDQKAIDEKIAKAKEQSGGDEGYTAALKEIGVTPKFYENFIYTGELATKYSELLEKEVKIEDKDLENYYEKNKDNYFTAKASHILVDNVELANKLKKELDKGADFAELAKENSIDPSNAKNGGELGEFKNGTMVSEFEEAIKLLKNGEISDPVKTQFGYHLIKLEDKKITPYEEVKDEIRKVYTRQKNQEYLDNLVKKAKIKKYLDPKNEIEIPEEYSVVMPAAAEQNPPAQGNEQKAQETNQAEQKANNAKTNNAKTNNKANNTKNDKKN